MKKSAYVFMTLLLTQQAFACADISGYMKGFSGLTRLSTKLCSYDTAYDVSTWSKEISLLKILNVENDGTAKYETPDGKIKSKAGVFLYLVKGCLTPQLCIGTEVFSSLNKTEGKIVALSYGSKRLIIKNQAGALLVIDHYDAELRNGCFDGICEGDIVNSYGTVLTAFALGNKYNPISSGKVNGQNELSRFGTEVTLIKANEKYSEEDRDKSNEGEFARKSNLKKAMNTKLPVCTYRKNLLFTTSVLVDGKEVFKAGGATISGATNYLNRMVAEGKCINGGQE